MGPLTLQRRYFSCPTCEAGDFGADRILGIDGYVTRGASRMACLLGVQRSFEKAQVALHEVAGWDLDDDTIRLICHATAHTARSTCQSRSTAKAFAQAEGDLELQIDAGKVNTQQGWRDAKAAVFDRRVPGEPTSASQWDRRDLPPPSVRSVVAAVEPAEAFGERIAAEAARLGLTNPKLMSGLGDGAEWIWNLMKRHFDGGGAVPGLLARRRPPGRSGPGSHEIGRGGPESVGRGEDEVARGWLRTAWRSGSVVWA